MLGPAPPPLAWGSGLIPPHPPRCDAYGTVHPIYHYQRDTMFLQLSDRPVAAEVALYLPSSKQMCGFSVTCGTGMRPTFAQGCYREFA